MLHRSVTSRGIGVFVCILVAGLASAQALDSAIWEFGGRPLFSDETDKTNPIPPNPLGIKALQAEWSSSLTAQRVRNTKETQSPPKWLSIQVLAGTSASPMAPARRGGHHLVCRPRLIAKGYALDMLAPAPAPSRERERAVQRGTLSTAPALSLPETPAITTTRFWFRCA